MELKLFWKSMIRRRVSALLLLLLIAASSFGFVLHGAEYLAVRGEISRISRRYRPIGTLSSAHGDITEGISLVEKSPYVEFEDIRRYCPAVLDGYYNTDLDGYSSDRGEYGYGVKISDLLVWGEVTKKMETGRTGVSLYHFVIKERVYGYPECAEPGNRLTLEISDEEGKMPVLEEGKTYLIKCYPPVESNYGHYGDGMSVNLLPLEEGLWFLEGEPDRKRAEQYVDEDALLQERNRHTMLAQTTADMSAMPLVQEASRDYYLEEGRWLNRQDQEESRKVCVITKEFAEIRGLSAGDSLTMTLKDSIVSPGGYTRSLEEDTWENGEKTEVTLEIVGICGRRYGGMIDDPGFVLFSRHSNLIYIPDSLLPEHYGENQPVEQDSFSFVLTSPREQDSFRQEVGGKLESLGITLSFVENNWDSFYHSAKAVEQGSFYSFLIFGAVMILTLGAVAFLYAWQRKKEIAIARALGVPAGKAAFCACFPLALTGAAGIFAGGGAAWKYGLWQAGQTLKILEAGRRPELSAVWFPGLCLLVFLILMLELSAGVFFHARKPVLEILQGTRGKRGKKQYETKKGLPEVTEKRNAIQETVGESIRNVPKTGKNRTFPEYVRERSTQNTAEGGKHFLKGVTVKFVGRHLYRFSLRTVLAWLAAAVFVLSSCWLYSAVRTGEREADRLYRSVSVETEIVKKSTGVVVTEHGGAYISENTIKKLLDTGFIQESFLVAGEEGLVSKEAGNTGTKKVSLVGIEDLKQYLSGSWNRMQIQDELPYLTERFQKDYSKKGRYGLLYMPVAILPEALWEEWKLEPGEQICLSDASGDHTVFAEAGGFYTGGTVGTGPILLPLSLLELLEQGNLYYMTAKFRLDFEKNRDLEIFREEAGKILEEPGAGLLELSHVIWDEELEQAVEPMEKNIALMRILCPLSNAVSLLAAGALSLLFLLQRKREAALLRILGTGIFQTRLMLALELLILNLTGILTGAGISLILTGNDSLTAMLLAAGCCLAGCFMGTTAGAVLVTRAKPMELLQEKEKGE